MKADSHGEVELGVLSGWGIVPDALVQFFPAGTLILPPTRGNATRLAGTARKLVGYSLGAWLLLDLASRGEKFLAAGTTLYAPFLAFPKEAGHGGKISATQVKFLRRWVKREPVPALADFYRRAGLSFPVPQRLPYDSADLDSGLSYLTDGYISAVPDVAKNWKIVIGAYDALLDAQVVEKIFSQSETEVVPAGTHDLATLVERAGTGSLF